ncbi:MAG TPA: rhomboid family intramembrane serine protease [Acetivibrio sp.]|nr:rhomboid family intramembrane serine protease [Clostridium sp.]HOQ36106.1 rhomboid family intramembrane serine protease [Acetivibrio sp.]HPT90169.1 rhomboid family intramembrane serine protease [Acetivibrio sp.]HQA57280.1 rhomboid family intramembrane serine protease [Acetivibrio sp.]
MPKSLQNIFRNIHYNSPVVLTMTFLSLGALILQIITKGQSTVLLFSVYRSSPLSILFYFRLFGHVLGHANWEHYINNFLLILLLGPMLEEKYGSRNMAFMISITALVTGLLNILLFDNVRLLGASGVVFMMILLCSFVNFKKGKIPLTFILVVIIYLGGEVMNGILVRDNISQLTHLIGGICGSIFGFRWAERYR